MSKARCTDCYNNRSTICKLGHKEIFNTKKAKSCPDFDEVAANKPIKLLPRKTETAAFETFAGEDVCFRFYK